MRADRKVRGEKAASLLTWKKECITLRLHHQGLELGGCGCRFINSTPLFSSSLSLVVSSPSGRPAGCHGVCSAPSIFFMVVFHVWASSAAFSLSSHVLIHCVLSHPCFPSTHTSDIIIRLFPDSQCSNVIFECFASGHLVFTFAFFLFYIFSRGPASFSSGSDFRIFRIIIAEQAKTLPDDNPLTHMCRCSNVSTH